MPGYGAGRADAPTARGTVELRSVNQLFLAVRIVAPREYAPWEREVRDRVRAVAQRGRVEVTVARTALAARRRYAVAVRAELARAYVAAARQLGRRLGLAGDVALVDVLRLPDVFEVSEQPPELRGELPALRGALARALRAFERERRREGAHLRRDMLGRAASLKRTTAAIRRRLPRALAVLRSQVEERLMRLVGGAELDRGRVAQEVAVLADRSDVTEELVRLEAHLGALATTLRDRGPAEAAGLTLEEYARRAETDHSIDRRLDDAMRARARRGDAVLEGRLAAVVAEEAGARALRVFLDAPEPVRAARIAGREGGDTAERLRQIQAREASDARRYREIYGVDYHDPQRYDLVLHTGGRSPEELAAEIVARARRAP